MEEDSSTSTSRKGTVTPLSSIFSVEEAQKAAKRVEEAIQQKQNELNNLNQFISDNTNLINLISLLPDQLHHDIMVPFGKAAFFPGKLIHTNELVVLLGEGYYAERTAKQTVDILKRRGKVLDSQVDFLMANIKDLRAEASFFDSTAFEAAEGLVEIREDYVEESSIEGQSKLETDDKKVGVEDDEYARMMSRLDELEKEELEAEGNNENDEDEHANTAESDNGSDENEHTDTSEGDDESEDEQTFTAERNNDSHENNQAKADFIRFPSQTHSEIRNPKKQPKVENEAIEAFSNRYSHQLDIADQSNCTGLTVQPLSKEKDLQYPAVKEKETISSSRNEVPIQTSNSRFASSRGFADSFVESSSNLQTIPQDQTAISSQPKTAGFDSSKAFTGSIVERIHSLPSLHEETTTSSESSNFQPSKPVSRFKMRRR